MMMILKLLILITRLNLIAMVVMMIYNLVYDKKNVSIVETA